MNYFEWRWDHDKNFLFQGKYKNIVEQMPLSVVENLLHSFVYVKFLKNFSKIFELPKQPPAHLRKCIKHSRYTWSDNDYKEFMVALLGSLEPRVEE